MMGFWDGRGINQLDHMQAICTSLQTDNHTNISLLMHTQTTNEMEADKKPAGNACARMNARTHRWTSQKHNASTAKGWAVRA